MKRTHGTGVAPTLVGSFLPTKVGEGIETVRVVEALLVLSMTTFHLSVVPGRIGADQFMPYPVFLQMFLKKGWFIPMGSEAVGELRSIVGLDTFNRAGKCLDQVFYKLRGRINAVFLKSFYKQR